MSDVHAAASLGAVARLTSFRRGVTIRRFDYGPVEAVAEETAKMGQIKVTRSSPSYWRVTFDNPPLNLMGPEFVLEFREIMTALEADQELRVVVFDSAVEGFFLNHSDFNAKL